MNIILKIKTWDPLVPYITIGIGLFVFSNVWAAVLGYHLSMAVILYLARRKASFSQILKNNSYKILIVTFILGGLGGLVLYLLWPWLAVTENINLFLHNNGFTTAMWPYFIVYLVLVNPWLEEYYWRGYLGSNSKMITLNDLFFSGYHIMILAGNIEGIWLVIVFILLTFIAWFWRQANRWNKGIAASVISHFAADTSIILTIYFLTRM